jgi:hypothetical protein
LARHSIHTRWTSRTTLALALALGTLPAAGCEIAPSQATCIVAMSPEKLGIIVHDGKVSGMVTVSCDRPVTRIHVSANVRRDKGGGNYVTVGSADYTEPSTDGNYVVTAPCIPGRWRFGYSVVVSANGETKDAIDTSDVTEVHPSDC